MSARLLPTLLLLLPSSAAFAQPAPVAPEDWKLDVVHRNKGRLPFKGLVVEQSAADVVIDCVYRKAGSPTVVLRDRVPRDEVDKLDLLDDKERTVLTTRLETLRRERKVLSAQIQLWKGGKIDLPPNEMLEMKPIPWGADGKEKGLAYESQLFRLESNAREDIVLLTAIQMEQLFTAYARYLPPRGDAPRTTAIVLTQSLEEYLKLVKARGHNILNPAFYDPKENQVVCGCDLERLGKELSRVQAQHAALLKDFEARRKELQRIYKNMAPPELIGPLDEAVRKVHALEKKNSDVLRLGHQKLVQRLCHESFHAYLNVSVFKDRKARVPAWLDEGLAQVFETALVEGGELQVGQPDPERLKRVRAALADKELLPLADLLRSTPKQFQVAHTADKQLSDRHYLASWALAFWLTFDRQTLGSGALDKYLASLERGTDPLDAFSAFLGSPLSDIEKQWLSYLGRLRQDGMAPMPK